MRLKARNVGLVAQTAPNWEFVVMGEDGRVWEDLEVSVDEAMHLVIVKVLGERVAD
jgi:hypothetical protein